MHFGNHEIAAVPSLTKIRDFLRLLRIKYGKEAR